MHDASVLYLDDYKPREEQAMRSCGVRTLRWERARGALAGALASHPRPDGLVFFRGPRLDAAAFAAVWDGLREQGLEPVTSPTSFRVASSFAAQYDLLRELSPRAVIIDAALADDEVCEKIARAGLAFPVFVRSDVESAAKHVGVDGCIAHHASRAELLRVLRPLRTHVREFRAVIAKELLPIATSEDGAALEYRAVGVRGDVIAFDHAHGDGPREIRETAARALRRLAGGGLTGAAFIDLAVVNGRPPIVVECKDFSHGTIAHPSVVAGGLLRWVAASGDTSMDSGSPS